MKKLLAVDGNSILNRAFYGVRPLNTKDGIPTNAVFGFVNILNRFITQYEPECCAVAFDLHAPTFRHKLYPEYKAGRHATPEELKEQFPYAKEIVRAMGLTVLELETYEADDILGTLADNGDPDCFTYILTGDRDALQLIDDKTTVLLATNGEAVVYSRDKFYEDYGLYPESFVDVKALMGDPSDNIPGVRGIGSKTALKLISEFGTLEKLYEALPSESLSAGINAKLEADRESAFLSKELSRIFRKVPLGITTEDIRRTPIDKDKALSLFTKLELSSFIKKFGLDAVEPVNVQASVSAKSDDIPAALFDKRGILLSAALCDDGLDVYDGFTVSRIRGNAKELEGILANNRILTYDCKAFYHALYKEGINYRNAEFDIMLGAYVIEPGASDYPLDKLVLKYLGETYSDAINDVQYIFGIYKPLYEKLKINNGEKLMHDIEMPTAAVLADMEIKGFKIDRRGIEQYGEILKTVENELAERIYFEAGTEFNINSPKQLGEVLFERLKMPSGKKTKTGYSTNAETLEKLRPYNHIIDDILEYRQAAKLRGTYAEGLLREADENGRIHTNFKQTGTATGRLSSTEPNLQNIPIKTKLGREFRRYFIPENENYCLIDADYSQIELRILAHISGDDSMISAFLSGKDIHTSTAATVFGVSPEAVTPEMRKRAKAVNFGILYGMGDFRLSNDLHISMRQAKDYIEGYLAAYPKIAQYLTEIKAEAREKGYVSTLMGRRRYIPELAGKNKQLQAFGERVAMNSPIQGSAADIIKLAMINVSEKLKGMDARLILQVHDELLIEANKECADEAERILKYEMENAVSLSVPLDVDINRGDNWYE